MKRVSIRTYLFFSFFLLGMFAGISQRIEIDRLEREFRGKYNSRKAYELSQKMIQLDSTYYVGHFLEANYRYLRASDKRGFESAIKSLSKAINLLEKDFPRAFRRSTDINVYINQYLLQRKFVILTFYLGKSYENIDKPGESIKVFERLKNYNFIYNFSINPYAAISWIYMRNRMYGPDKYDFLKPTIEENLAIASKYADSTKNSDRYNKKYLRMWWPNAENDALLSYYHYKNILYGYQFKLDSAEYCSKQLKRYGRLSNNNYGNLQFVQAKYPEAQESYYQARLDDNYQEKSIKEFDYMQSAIKVFENDVASAKSIVEESIDNLGVAPGFGWNNIALSRAYYYAGDLEKSKVYRDKAANFREIHINSTWGEVAYERNTLLFKYLYHKKSMNELKFRDQDYWYKPAKLYELSKHHFKQENAHLLLTSELSADPERFESYYKLFSTDNTMFFDELWELIKYFNPDYFIDIFKKNKNKDERDRIQKYFTYFIAKFYLEDEEYDKAIQEFEKVLKDDYLDLKAEKLLVARIHEAMSTAYAEKDNKSKADKHLLEFYKNFPQLIPYSDLKMKFVLEVANSTLNEEQKKIIEEVKNCEVDWIASDTKWPTLKISFSEKDKKPLLNYQVVLQGETTFEGSLEINEVDNPGQLATFKAFGIDLE